MQRLWAWLTWQIEEAGQREAQRRVETLVGGEARGGGHRAMDEGQVEGFVAAAERDYRTVVDGYCSILGAEWHWDEAELRQARADVLAAQQVLALARSEEEGARQAADWGHGGAQGMAKWKSGMAEMARGVEEAES